MFDGRYLTGKRKPSWLGWVGCRNGCCDARTPVRNWQGITILRIKVKPHLDLPLISIYETQFSVVTPVDQPNNQTTGQPNNRPTEQPNNRTTKQPNN
jgi:hypothetical protein